VSEATPPHAAEAVEPDVTPPDGISTSSGRRPRPRPRPRPDAAEAAGKHADPTQPDSSDEDPIAATAQAGFGPTSATGTPAPPHALFTPASTEGAGAMPGPDGAAPGPEFTIKGNVDSMLFHTPESPYFERTRAEVWFRNADEAVAAGFTEWRAHRRTS
jgi:hypothetical protein